MDVRLNHYRIVTLKYSGFFVAMDLQLPPLQFNLAKGWKEPDFFICWHKQFLGHHFNVGPLFEGISGLFTGFRTIDGRTCCPPTLKLNYDKK